MTATDLLYGYGRDGASEAHYVRLPLTLRQAPCGVALESIPLHQMAPSRVCWACQALAPTMPPAPASVLSDDPAPDTGVCTGCGDGQPLDAAGRVQPHDVERVRDDVAAHVVAIVAAELLIHETGPCF